MDSNKGEQLITNIKGYLNLRYEVMRLEVTRKISGSGSVFISSIILCVFALITILFFSIAAGFYLSVLYGSRIQGFSLVGGFYLLVTFVLFLFRKKLLSEPVEDKMIHELLKEKSN
jgi:hypothetical protein